MKNLKRVLSMALASVMLAGMMVVGAGAADADNFTDGSEIGHKDAVSTMVALNIINGKPDGSFDPEATVTRAEMAKMITIALNGGSEPVLGIKGTPSFTDIKGHWAEKYIEYCAGLKIISGRGDGTFDPAGTVTGTEAAKMMLTAMGFDATVFEFTGMDWALNVNRWANDRGLYEELKGIDPDQGMSRDNVAQLIYNGILANGKKVDPEMSITSGEITYSYTDSNSIFVEKYKGTDKDGILRDYTYDADKGTWSYDVVGAATLVSDEDFTHLFGMNVRVLYKTVNGKTTFYGMFPYESSVLVEGYAGQIGTIAATDTSAKINGVTVKFDTTASAVTVYNQGATTPAGNITAKGSSDTGYTFKVLDTNGDGKADKVVVTPFTVTKVTYVGKTSMTATGVGSVDFDDIEVYEGVAKDDYVMVIDGANSATEKTTFTKLEKVENAVTGKKGTSTIQYRLDGKWYTNISNAIDVEDTIEYIALGSVIYYAKVVEGATGSQTLAMIYQLAPTTAGGVDDEVLEARLLFADGTKKKVLIDKINGENLTSGGSGVIDDIDNAFATGDAINGDSITGVAGKKLLGQLVSYKIDNDGNYEVTLLGNDAGTADGDKILGYDGLVKDNAYTNSSTSVGGVELADDAIVFVYKGAAETNAATNSAKVYTGKELKNTNANFGSVAHTYANGLLKKVNGFTYVQVVALGHSDNPDIVTGANYGYLTSNAYTSYDHEAGKNYVYFTFWDGSDEVTKRAEGNDYTAFVAGAIITYDVVSGDEIKNVSMPTTVTAKVDGWDGDKKIAINGLTGTREIDSDTCVLFVSSKDKVGVAGDVGMIAEAEDVNGDSVVEPNVRYIAPASGTKIALLVVDVNNDMKNTPNPTILSGTIDAAAITAALNGGNAEVDASGLSAAGTVSVAKGQKLTITDTSASNALTVNVAKGATVKVTDTTITTGKLIINAAAGSTVILPNGTLVGEYLTVVSGTVKIEAAASNGVKISADAATLKVEKDLVLGSNDVLDVTGITLTGAAAGKTITFKAAANLPAYTGFYTDAGNETTAATALAATVAANDVYAWGTIYTDTEGNTSEGWVKE